MHCRAHEPQKEPSSKWCLHKTNGPAVSYEIAIDIFESKLVWLNGPFPAGQTDLAIFQKEDGLKNEIPNGKCIIGDRGYCGDQHNNVSIRNPCDTPQVKEFKNRALA